MIKKIKVFLSIPFACQNPVGHHFHLYVGQRGPGMMTEPAHELAGVAVIVRVTSVGRVKTQFPAIVQRADVLVHRVDGFQDTAREFLELAQFDGFVHAVVLQIVDPGRRFEYPLSRHRQPVHVRQFAFGRTVVVIGRSVNNERLLLYEC